MDLSSLTEAQQQQLQQLHQQFQQHQLQRQQEQQQQQQELLASQSYNQSTQIQSYDQSNPQPAYDPSNQSYDQSYYPYSHYPTHQHYPYYHQDYANAYNSQSQQSQAESTTIQPPGISSVRPEGQSQPQQQQQQSAYYPQSTTEQQQNPSSSSSYTTPSGLNAAAAAAVAALSQLTQFAGSMDAAERAMAGYQERQWQEKNVGGVGYDLIPPPIPYPSHGGFYHGQYPVHPGVQVGRSPYNSGGGGRGGPAFRGGRGNYGNRHPRQDSSAPYSRGRGRGGKGRGRQVSSFQVHRPDSALAHEVAAQSAEGQGVIPQTVPVPTQPRQMAWCELCRVDCTSLEILEQHKNGKKHKKNLQRFEELQNSRNSTAIPVSIPMVTNTPAPGSTPNPTPTPNLNPAPEPSPSTTQVSAVAQFHMPGGNSETTTQTGNVHGAEIIVQNSSENLPIGNAIDENKMDSQQQNVVAGQTQEDADREATAGTKKRRMDRFDNKRRGLKRKLKGGRGGKRTRLVEQREPPKEVLPIICDLCNVKCDTQEVFNCHQAGKKHLSKLKRFQSHQAMYGAAGLQALYPPNPNTQPIYVAPQAHNHQPPTYMPPQQPMMGYGSTQGPQIAAAAASEPKQVNSERLQMVGSMNPQAQVVAVGPVVQEAHTQAI